ncbi:unnamed protein product, partial [Prorocentrum cordatum]
MGIQSAFDKYFEVTAESAEENMEILLRHQPTYMKPPKYHALDDLEGPWLRAKECLGTARVAKVDRETFGLHEAPGYSFDRSTSAMLQRTSYSALCGLGGELWGTFAAYDAASKHHAGTPRWSSQCHSTALGLLFAVAAPRSAILTAAGVLACASLMAIFGPSPVALHRTVWTLALPAVGAGFAIGLVAIGSGVGQGMVAEPEAFLGEGLPVAEAGGVVSQSRSEHNTPEELSSTSSNEGGGRRSTAVWHPHERVGATHQRMACDISAWARRVRAHDSAHRHASKCRRRCRHRAPADVPEMPCGAAARGSVTLAPWWSIRTAARAGGDVQGRVKRLRTLGVGRACRFHTGQASTAEGRTLGTTSAASARQAILAHPPPAAGGRTRAIGPPSLDGRVVSTVLPTKGSTRVWLSGVHGDVHSLENRAGTCENIAKRVCLSSLPAIGGHDAVSCELEVGTRVTAQAVLEHPRLHPPSDLRERGAESRGAVAHRLGRRGGAAALGPQGLLGGAAEGLGVDGVADLARAEQRTQHPSNHIAIANWGDRLEGRHLSGIAKFTRDGADAAGPAANDSDLCARANPRLAMSDALKAWKKQQLSHLEPEDHEQHVDEARPHGERVPPPPPRGCTVDDLRKALEDAAHPAAVPGQWDAGFLARAPDVALGLLAQIVGRDQTSTTAAGGPGGTRGLDDTGASRGVLARLEAHVGCAIGRARAPSRVAVRISETRGRRVQATDVRSSLLEVGFCAARAKAHIACTRCRQSDRANCLGAPRKHSIPPRKAGEHVNQMAVDGGVSLLAAMAAPRSTILTAAVVLAFTNLMAAFVPSPVASPRLRSRWILVLSAIGAGFAIGVAAIGSRVGQGLSSGRCIDGMSPQTEVADDAFHGLGLH